MYLDKSEKIFLPVKICKYKVPYTFYIGKKGCVSHYYETLTKDVLSYICTVLFLRGIEGGARAERWNYIQGGQVQTVIF